LVLRVTHDILHGGVTVDDGARQREHENGDVDELAYERICPSFSFGKFENGL
jgi:hypothetical protein